MNLKQPTPNIPMSLTANQKYTLSALHQANGPLTAYELLERLRKQGFKAPTQVYRALDKLIEQGLVHRLETLNAYVTCSYPSHCKLNFTAFAICDICGNADEFAVNPVGLNHWVKNHGFILESSVIEIRGQCIKCAYQGKTKTED